MKTLKQVLMATGVIAALGLSANQAAAQDEKTPPQRQRGGGFEQYRQRETERLRAEFDVKDDAEWKALDDKITKVREAQREVMADRIGGMMGGRGGSRGGSSDTNSTAGDQNTRGRGGFRGFGDPSPEVAALKKTLDDKTSSADDINAKLEKLRAAKKAKEAKEESAEEDLRKLLTPRQEAVAVLNGLLK